MTADLGKLMRENQLLFAEFVRRYDEMAARLAAAGTLAVDHSNRITALQDSLAAAERWMRHAQNEHADECGTCNDYARSTVAYLSKPVPMFCTNCGEPAPTGPTTTNERAHCPKCGESSWAGTADLNFSDRKEGE